jgi:hypothetical protein
MPGPLKLRKPAYKGREAGFMVLIVKPDHVPSPDDLSVVGARLIFQEKIVLEQRKAWWDS